MIVISPCLAPAVGNPERNALAKPGLCWVCRYKHGNTLLLAGYPAMLANISPIEVLRGSYEFSRGQTA